MAPRRQRVSVGIYRDVYGLAATVKCKGVQRERRWPHDTPLDELRQWQDDTRAQLRREGPTLPRAPSRMLARDMVRYLRQIAGRVSAGSERSHLKAWLKLYPTIRRRELRTEHVNRAIATWRTAGAATNTILHRCRTLRVLYHTLDGPRAPTPFDDAMLPKVPPPHPVGVSPAVIRRVARNLAKTGRPLDYARYLVLVTTGQRPAQVARAQPEDIQLRRRVWLVRASKGGPSHTVYLNADMLRAWRVFIAAKAWGKYDTSAFAQYLRAAGWPQGVRPYNARHSVAIDAIRAGASLSDVQALLGHTSPETTRRSYAPVMQAEQRRVSERLAGRIRW